EVDCFTRDLQREIYPSHAWSGVEVGRAQRALNRSGLRARGKSFEGFSLLLAGEHVGSGNVAIAASGPERHASAVNLDPDGVASTLRLFFRRNVTQGVVFVEFSRDPVKAGEKVVGIENRKSTRAGGERVEHLLVGGRRLRYLWNYLARLVKRIV